MNFLLITSCSFAACLSVTSLLASGVGSEQMGKVESCSSNLDLVDRVRSSRKITRTSAKIFVWYHRQSRWDLFLHISSQFSSQWLSEILYIHLTASPSNPLTPHINLCGCSPSFPLVFLCGSDGMGLEWGWIGGVMTRIKVGSRAREGGSNNGREHAAAMDPWTTARHTWSTAEGGSAEWSRVTLHCMVYKHFHKTLALDNDIQSIWCKFAAGRYS